MTLKTGQLVIASGQSASTPLRLDSDTIVGLYTPAAWDTADVSFEASHDGASFVEMQEFGAPVSIQGVAQKYVPLDFTKFVGVTYLRVRSSAGGSPVPQSANRTLTAVYRALE